MKKLLKKILYPVSIKIKSIGSNLYDWCMTETACKYTPTQSFCSDCEIRGCCKKANFYLGTTS